MPPRAAPTLDRRITLLIPGPEVGDDYGHDQPGEPTPAPVWANRTDAAPRDQLSYDNDQRLDVHLAVFTIRYRADVRAGWQIIDDEGQRRCVVGRSPTERRRRYLALLCEAIT